MSNSLDQDQCRHFACHGFKLFRPEFFISCMIYWNVFSDLGLGGRKEKKKASKMTGPFHSFSLFLNISRTNSKTSKVNQQSVLNL